MQAIIVRHYLLEFYRSLGLDYPSVVCLNRNSHLFWPQIEIRFTFYRIFCKVKQLLILPVDKEVSSLYILDVNDRSGIVKNGTQFLIALAQCHLRLFALDDRTLQRKEPYKNIKNRMVFFFCF